MGCSLWGERGGSETSIVQEIEKIMSEVLKYKQRGSWIMNIVQFETKSSILQITQPKDFEGRNILTIWGFSGM